MMTETTDDENNVQLRGFQKLGSPREEKVIIMFYYIKCIITFNIIPLLIDCHACLISLFPHNHVIIPHMVI